jgi:serine/threonine protein kinase
LHSLLSSFRDGRTGEEINDCMMIRDHDLLIISDGKPFNPGKTPNEGAEDQVKTVGPYLVGNCLGSGGFSDVHVGSNTITGQKVALKFVNKSQIHSFFEAERAALEYQVLSSLNHRNIIKLLSVSPWNKQRTTI